MSSAAEGRSWLRSSSAARASGRRCCRSPRPGSGAGRPAWRGSSALPLTSARSSSSDRSPQIDEPRQVEPGPRLPGRVVRDAAPAGCRGRLPGRCRSRRRACRARRDTPRECSTAVLDRQVRQAAGRVEDARLDERAGRTGLETRVQLTALLQPLRVGLERQRADDLAEEEPGAELGVDQAGVLANPARARHTARRRAPAPGRCRRRRAPRTAPGDSARIQARSASSRAFRTSW